MSLDGARVLIAEDNPVNMEVASFHLEDLGCIAGAALNGQIAVELYKKQPFDFVLMDCQMPVMDGFAALRAIRAHEATAAGHRSTIIAVTAADDAESQMLCAAAGFDGFLAKPFTAAQLEAVLVDCRASLDRAASGNSASPACSSPSDVAKPPLVIDPAVFAAFVADFGADTAPSLLASYVKLLHETSARFDEARANQNSAALQALAHKVAGASGTVGASALANHARSIEGACKRREFKWSDEIAPFGEAIAAARAVFEPLLTPADLNAFLATSTSAKPLPV